MKKVSLLVVLLMVVFFATQAQDAKVMESRARELHRVIGLSDQSMWEKFVRENYTEALIKKPMKAQVEGDGPQPAATADDKSTDQVVAKARMFKMLHQDFGNSKITSIKTNAETLTMLVDGNGLAGTFTLRFQKTKPYLIDGIGIEVGNVDR